MSSLNLKDLWICQRLPSVETKSGPADECGQGVAIDCVAGYQDVSGWLAAR